MHRCETSNSLNESVRCKQKRLQRLSETVTTNNRTPQAVWQGIPDRRTSHTESPSAIGAELVTRYDQELLDNLLKTQPKLLPKNLTFRPLSEAFIRKSWYSVLLVLDTMGRRCQESGRMCGLVGSCPHHSSWPAVLPFGPLSWHSVFPLCQEPEKLSTSFFWWRPLIEVETSSFM